MTLFGDVGHPLLPHAGQGAAQALEDALALGRALASASPASAALRRYEQQRAPRRRAIALVAKRNARVGSVRSTWGCWIRDWLVRSVPERIVTRSLLAAAAPSR